MNQNKRESRYSFTLCPGRHAYNLDAVLRHVQNVGFMYLISRKARQNQRKLGNLDAVFRRTQDF